MINKKCPLTAAVYLDIVADVFELLIENNGKKFVYLFIYQDLFRILESIAEDFISKFEGRLWTQGKDCSIQPSIDIASMNASGALLWKAVERSLQLIGQMRVSISEPKKDSSISIHERISKVKPTLSFTKPDQEIYLHWLQGSLGSSSLAHRTGLDVGSSEVDQASDLSLSKSLSKHENAVHLASDTTSHTIRRNGSRHYLFSPQQSDDELRTSGEAVVLACKCDTERLTNYESISKWICRISLAADERSVSILNKSAISFADCHSGSFHKARSGRVDSRLL